MTPRFLRRAIQRGEITAVDPRIYRGKAPAPPAEYPEWRRDRMRVAIRAALLFLSGKPWQDISRLLELEGLLNQERTQKRGAVVSKARIAQYVSKGVEFLVGRGCFKEVRKRSKE
jgi:hypothetical protein